MHNDNNRGDFEISIHAPRTGSDIIVLKPRCFNIISIHAPRTGSDRIPFIATVSKFAFQSTLPARGATKRIDNRPL